MNDQLRDYQRQRVYRAEYTVDRGARLNTMAELRAYVDAITGAPWFVERWGQRTIEVRDGRGRRSAAGSPSGWITMPIEHRSELIVCHEVAHVVTGRRGGGGWHGPGFTAAYWFIVQQQMGKAHGVALGNAFFDGNVDVDHKSLHRLRDQAARP